MNGSTVVTINFGNRIDLNTLALVSSIEEQVVECRKQLVAYLTNAPGATPPASLEITVG